MQLITWVASPEHGATWWWDRHWSQVLLRHWHTSFISNAGTVQRCHDDHSDQLPSTATSMAHRSGVWSKNFGLIFFFFSLFLSFPLLSSHEFIRPKLISYNSSRDLSLGHKTSEVLFSKSGPWILTALSLFIWSWSLCWQSQLSLFNHSFQCLT